MSDIQLPSRAFQPLTLEKLKAGGPFVALRFALNGATTRNVFDFPCSSECCDEFTCCGIKLRVRLMRNIGVLIAHPDIISACPNDVELALRELNSLLNGERGVLVRVDSAQDGPDDYIEVENIDALKDAIFNIYCEVCRN